MFATFELAIQKAAGTCPAAEALMGLCAFLAPERIPLDIVTADVMSEIERGEAVAVLQEVSLASLETLDDGSTGISVHRLGAGGDAGAALVKGSFCHWQLLPRLRSAFWRRWVS